METSSLLRCIILVMLLALGSRLAAQPAASPDAPRPELFRIRIENARFGSIEVSADGGAHYALVGRVTRPAEAFATDPTARILGQTGRCSDAGIVISLGHERAITLIPAGRAVEGAGRLPGFSAVDATGTIATNIRRGTSIFGGLCPAAGSDVGSPGPGSAVIGLVDGYLPSDGDVLTISASCLATSGPARHPQHRVRVAALTGARPRSASAHKDGTSTIRAASATSPQPPAGSDPRAVVEARLTAAAANYAASAVARAKAAGETIVSGTLLVKAKLPGGEPDPIAGVLYSVDDDTVAAQNAPPYAYSWDTHRAENGEHVVEVRALSSGGATITRSRALIVVENPLPAK